MVFLYYYCYSCSFFQNKKKLSKNSPPFLPERGISSHWHVTRRFCQLSGPSHLSEFSAFSPDKCGGALKERFRSAVSTNALSITIYYRLSGHSSGGFNEEVIWISIGMSITIVILITIALCYLARQRCKKRQEISVRT